MKTHQKSSLKTTRRSFLIGFGALLTTMSTKLAQAGQRLSTGEPALVPARVDAPLNRQNDYERTMSFQTAWANRYQKLSKLSL